MKLNTLSVVAVLQSQEQEPHPAILPESEQTRQTNRCAATYIMLEIQITHYASSDSAMSAPSKCTMWRYHRYLAGQGELALKREKQNYDINGRCHSCCRLCSQAGCGLPYGRPTTTVEASLYVVIKNRESTGKIARAKSGPFACRSIMMMQLGEQWQAGEGAGWASP